MLVVRATVWPGRRRAGLLSGPGPPRGVDRSSCPLREGVDVRRRSRFVLAVVGAAVLSLSLAGGVAAQPPVKEQIHEEFSEVFEDFCEVEGLTVRQDVVFDSRLQ